MSDPAPAPPEKAATPDEPHSKLGRFITRYHTFLSSFVIGVAGLMATSIWQCRQSATQASQAAATQKVAETQAQNSWKIERAEILGKNLQTLAASGSAAADQKFGVLLSLTRAEILDPELAVSYALELGKDNADYMLSVLASTPNKNYVQLERAFTLSCDEKYGVSPAVDACSDKLIARSAAIGQLIADELGPALAGDGSPAALGPLALLKDERKVQLDVQQLTGLFEPAIVAMYDARQWDELAKFAASSPGAHLVESLALAAARTGEFVTDDEAKTLAQFHAAQTKWLDDYLVSKPCDAECKGRLVEVMLSHYEEAQGDFDASLRKLLESAHTQSGIAVTHLHSRLLWCQVGDADLAELRDRVLVPAAAELTKPVVDPSSRGSIVSLLAIVPEPAAPDAVASLAWANALASLDADSAKQFRDRRAKAAKHRQAPPPAMKKLDFCIAQPATAVMPGGSAAPADAP